MKPNPTFTGKFFFPRIEINFPSHVLIGTSIDRQSRFSQLNENFILQREHFLVVDGKFYLHKANYVGFVEKAIQ